MEVGATAPRDAAPEADGSIPIVTRMENTLVALMEDGRVLDAVVATSEAQRAEMWARREAAAEVGMGRKPAIVTDIAVPLDRVATFLDRMNGELAGMDAGAEVNVVSHLGDGNVHYVVWPTSQDPKAHDAIVERVEDVVLSLGGSFSAEHGVGLSKMPSMARRKDPVALDVMRAIKAALDPKGILNPGKLLP
jgi:FAD/FMN-containing dehydrogenase